MVTVADRVNLSSVSRSVLLEDAVTPKSALPCVCCCVSSTTTSTDAEQLFVVSDSSVTVSTHAP